MAEIANLILEPLRHIRGAFDDVRDDIRDMKRVGSLESHYTNVSNRLAGIDMRIECIGRRLDLTDA